MTIDTPSVDDRLETLAALFGECRRAGIRVCHWKSNSHLEAAICGRTDLDLLVHPDDARAFIQLLRKMRVQPFHAAPGKEYPNVENWIGFDRPTGRLFHLHVHHELILGQQHVKDYTLPLVDRMLDGGRDLFGVPVPAPELELAVLCVRALLKYRVRDAVKDLVSTRSAGLPEHIRREIEWLEEQVSERSFLAALDTVSDVIPSNTVLEFLETWDTPRPGLGLLRLRLALRRSLRAHRRIGRSAATLRYVVARLRKRLPIRRRRMSRPDGGLIVAVVGADGAGKSTIVGEISHWLGWRITVDRFYMGTNRPTPTTAALAHAARGLRRLARRVPSMQRPAILLTALRRVAEAGDRRRRSRAISKSKGIGSIVLCDRYPLREVTIGGRWMDGPRIRTEFPRPGAVVGRLMKWEERLLAAIEDPDVVVALHVDAGEAVRRSPDHDQAAVSEKDRAVRDIDRVNLDLVEVDATRSLEAVVADVKEALWCRI